MKLNRLLIPFYILILISVHSCKNNVEKQAAKKTEYSLYPQQLVKENKATIQKNDNVYEIHQSFLKSNDNSNIVGETIFIDLSTTSGAMMSAYSKLKEDYKIYFRTLEKDSWSGWVELKENLDVQNPERKAFSPTILTNSVSQIQFKSNKVVQDSIIFRIYTFKKQ